MHSNIVSLVRGFVRLRVRGKQTELLLNRLVDEHIMVWNISRMNEELELDIHLSDFYRLRAFLKETGCRMRVIARFGVPFWLHRLERRKFWVAGLLGFVLGLYMLSSLVWSVQIIGNERVSAQTVREIAAEQGIRPWAWKFLLADLDTLSARLMQRIPEAAWIGVSVQGTRVTIELVENTVPEERPLMNPRHLVSTSDAVITEIITEQGKPMVRRNMRVKKGDILISGIIGSDNFQQVVVAKGEVKGLVWYEYEVNVPLKQSRKVYTGNKQDRFYLVFGNRALQITGYGHEPYAQEVKRQEREVLKWRDYTLPFGWINEETYEVRIDTYEINPDSAKQRGLSQVRADIVAKFGTEAQIHDEKILHESIQNGKVYMKVLLEVEHSISEERPIVPLAAGDPISD
jgi:similar to stage IV sporulation protein